MSSSLLLPGNQILLKKPQRYTILCAAGLNSGIITKWRLMLPFEEVFSLPQNEGFHNARKDLEQKKIITKKQRIIRIVFSLLLFALNCLLQHSSKAHTDGLPWPCSSLRSTCSSVAKAKAKIPCQVAVRHGTWAQEILRARCSSSERLPTHDKGREITLKLYYPLVFI